MRLLVLGVFFFCSIVKGSDLGADSAKGPLILGGVNLEMYQSSPGLRRRSSTGVFRPVVSTSAVEGFGLMQVEGSLVKAEEDDELFEEEWRKSVHDVDAVQLEEGLRKVGGAVFYISSDDEAAESEEVGAAKSLKKDVKKLRKKPDEVGMVLPPPKDELQERLKAMRLEEYRYRSSSRAVHLKDGIAASGKARNVASLQCKETVSDDDEVDDPKPRIITDQEMELRMGFACRRLGALLWNREEHLEGHQAVVPQWHDFEDSLSRYQKKQASLEDSAKK